MHAIRQLLAQRHLATLICAAALVLKLLVPTGYMVGSDHGRVTVIICSGTSPRTVTMEMPGMDHAMPDHGSPKSDGNAGMPCAFAGLSSAAVSAVDPLQLVTLIAFVMAIGFAGAAVPAPARPPRFRPPLRGPPLSL